MAQAQAALTVRRATPVATRLRWAWREATRGGLLVWRLVLAGAALAPFDPTAQDPISRLREPFSYSRRGFHVFGTDALGRDLWSNMIVATRLTLIIGVVCTGIGAIIGTSLGMWAGFYGVGV